MTHGVGRRIMVRVPGTMRSAGGDSAVASGQWLTASFVLDAARRRRIERGGALRGLGVRDDEDFLMLGFSVACGVAGVDVPAALRCRAVSDIPIGVGRGASAAAVVAGVVGARALLDLPLDDAAVEGVAIAIDRSSAQVRLAIGAHTCVQYALCDDPSAVA